MNPEITDVVAIVDVVVIQDCNQLEVHFERANGAYHFTVYDQSAKDTFIADLENPAYGGKEGDSTRWLQAVGW